MFATKFCLSVAAAMLTATAAAAAEPRDAPTTAPTTTPAAAPVAIPAAPAITNRGLSQRYCIVDDVTGSRIRQQECGSLAEWQVRGIDPRKMRRLTGWRTAGGL